MGIMVYSLLWVMQDFDHQPYLCHHGLHDFYLSYRAKSSPLVGDASIPATAATTTSSILHTLGQILVIGFRASALAMMVMIASSIIIIITIIITITIIIIIIIASSMITIIITTTTIIIIAPTMGGNNLPP